MILIKKLKAKNFLAINSPNEGVRVAMFIDNGAPVELIEFNK